MRYRMSFILEVPENPDNVEDACELGRQYKNKVVTWMDGIRKEQKNVTAYDFEYLYMGRTLPTKDYPRAMRDQLRLNMGQCGDDSFGHNAGWYDKHGQKIGWGDIGKIEVNTIPLLLKPGQVLITTGEHASFWDVPKDMNPEFPGIDYVIKHARLIFMSTASGTVQVGTPSWARYWIPDKYDDRQFGKETVLRGEVFKVLLRDDIKGLLGL